MRRARTGDRPERCDAVPERWAMTIKERGMSERKSRVAIAASLLWIVLAVFVILGTHGDVVAQLGADEITVTAPDAGVVVAPLAKQPKAGQC